MLVFDLSHHHSYFFLLSSSQAPGQRVFPFPPSDYVRVIFFIFSLFVMIVWQLFLRLFVFRYIPLFPLFSLHLFYSLIVNYITNLRQTPSAVLFSFLSFVFLAPAPITKSSLFPSNQRQDKYLAKQWLALKRYAL